MNRSSTGWIAPRYRTVKGSGRPCRNEKPFGTKFLATASALLSEVSSAIF